VLFLPDRDAVLDFVDDEAAGAEGFVAVVGADADPHSHFANAELAHAMHTLGGHDAELRDGLLDDARARSTARPSW
jgi:hypothetical protein